MIQHTATPAGLTIADGVFWYLYFVATLFVAYYAMKFMESARAHGRKR